MPLERHRRLQALYARLYGQLDQKIGREKRILTRYIRALDRLLKEESAQREEKDRRHA